MDLKKPKFYIDKQGLYGDIIVEGHMAQDRKGRNRPVVSVFNRGEMLLSTNSDTHQVTIFSQRPNPENLGIINECFLQLDLFRALLLISQQGEWFLIVDGQKVPFVHGMEVLSQGGSYYVAVPWRPAQVSNA